MYIFAYTIILTPLSLPLNLCLYLHIAVFTSAPLSLPLHHSLQLRVVRLSSFFFFSVELEAIAILATLGMLLDLLSLFIVLFFHCSVCGKSYSYFNYIFGAAIVQFVSGMCRSFFCFFFIFFYQGCFTPASKQVRILGWQHIYVSG